MHFTPIVYQLSRAPRLGRTAGNCGVTKAVGKCLGERKRGGLEDMKKGLVTRPSLPTHSEYSPNFAENPHAAEFTQEKSRKILRIFLQI